MIEITNVEYREGSPAADHAAAQSYRSLIISVRLPDDTAIRFLVDAKAIRMLDSPAAKGAILRRTVERIVIRVHAATIFSVVVFVRRGLAARTRSALMGLVQAGSPTYPEDLGTSLHGFDADQIAVWLRSLGYPVELMHVAPACEPAEH